MKKTILIMMLILLFAIIGCDEKKSNSIVKIFDDSNQFSAIIAELSSHEQAIIIGANSIYNQISSVFVSVDNTTLSMNYNNEYDVYEAFFDSNPGDTINVFIRINGSEMINTDLVLIHGVNSFSYPVNIAYNSKVPFRWERDVNVNQQYFETAKTWFDYDDSDYHFKNKCSLIDRNKRSYTSNINWIGDGHNELLEIEFTLHSMNYKRKNGLILASYEPCYTTFSNYRSSEFEGNDAKESFRRFKRISLYLD